MIFEQALPRKLLGQFSFKGMTLEHFARTLIKESNQHEILTRSAAIAFYALLAFVPFIAVLLTLAVQLLPTFAALSVTPGGIEQQAINELEGWLVTVSPQSAYAILDTQISRVQNEHSEAIISISLLFSLWVSSSLFMAVMDALNHIYETPEKKRYWKRRAISMAMTLIQSVLLLLSLLIIVVLPGLLHLVGLGFVATIAANTVHFFASFIIVLYSFALTFQIGPHAEQRTAWVTPGSFFGSLFFLLITYLFRIYVEHFGSYDKVYGSLGGVVVLILWFYLSAIVLLGAASINKILAPAPAPTHAPETAQH